MIESTLSQAAIWTGATLEGADNRFVGVSTDTREPLPPVLGELAGGRVWRLIPMRKQ